MARKGALVAHCSLSYYNSRDPGLTLALRMNHPCEHLQAPDVFEFEVEYVAHVIQ